MLDILYLAWNRLEFTRASLESLLANTHWPMVRSLWLYDDGSTDGTLDLIKTVKVTCPVNLVQTRFQSPVAIMNDFVARAKPELFAKIDNDVVVPPYWLRTCKQAMDKSPDVDMLGIEPMYPVWMPSTEEREVENPHKVVPNFSCTQDYIARRPVMIHGVYMRQGDHLPVDSPIRKDSRRLGQICGHRALYLETLDEDHRVGFCSVCNRTEVVDLREDGDAPKMETVLVPTERACVTTGHIGGIGVMRAKVFEGQRMPKPNGRFGFTIWQKYHLEVIKAWLNPALPVILLDRLPMKPWRSLSAQYVTNGWQRPWDAYTEADRDLWSWWEGVCRQN